MVSVIIPTYNSAALLAQAIDSVLAQSALPAEIIVVDDGSTDATEQLVQRHGSRVKYVWQRNQGVSAARNRGVASASGEFVAFLDADDVWHPKKLELQMAAFRRSPDLGLLGTLAFDWPIRSFPALPESIRFNAAVQVTWEELVVKNRLITSSVVVRRSVLEQTGEFDLQLQGPEDRDLWLRIAEVSKIANLPCPLTGYRMVEGSVSKQAATCHAGMRRILQKIDERHLWRGRWLLRRKAYGYMNHSSAYLFGACGQHRVALWKSLRSFAWYPVPFQSDETATRFERPKRALVTLLRMLHLRRPSAPLASAVAAGELDALEAARNREVAHG
jgi:glycosyltransferase involved in cell wall biosynthesis